MARRNTAYKVEYAHQPPFATRLTRPTDCMIRAENWTLVIPMPCVGMQIVIFHLSRDAGASWDEFPRRAWEL